MKLTTIQLYEETKKKLEEKKAHPRESYDSLLRRMLESETIPSMEQMFKAGDKLQQKRGYSTEEVIELTHKLRLKK